MIPRGRLEALTDGIFTIAMTLLVLEVRLPDTFHPRDGAELVGALGELEGPLVAYVISFFVVGAQWLGQVSRRPGPEASGGVFGFWTLVYLFFITAVPFSSMVVGRYVDLAPAIWLYGANMLCCALVSIYLSLITARQAGRPPGSMLNGGTLIASVALSVAISFFDPGNAMWAYLLNVLPPLVRVWRRTASAE